MRKYFLGIIVLMVVIFLTGCGNSNNLSDQDINAKTILFTSSVCPHCKDVENYIKDNKVKEKVSFSEIVVNSSDEGAKLMVEKQRKCQLEGDYIGAVPFLWNNGECYLGDEKIIEFFKEKNEQ